MNLDQQKFSVGMPDQSMFRATDDYPHLAISGTAEIEKFDEATHYPNGFIKPGTILALQDAGGGSGYWGAYVHDHSGGFNLETPGAMVWSGFTIETIGGTPVGSYSLGSILLAGLPIQVILSKLPGLLDDADAAYTPVLADLPAGFISVPV